MGLARAVLQVDFVVYCSLQVWRAISLPARWDEPVNKVLVGLVFSDGITSPLCVVHRRWCSGCCVMCDEDCSLWDEFGSLLGEVQKQVGFVGDRESSPLQCPCLICIQRS